MYAELLDLSHSHCFLHTSTLTVSYLQPIEYSILIH